MAEGVVHDLEPVEVEKEDRQPGVVAAGVVQRHPHLVEEQLPVGQAGERVVIGDALDLRRRLHRRLPFFLQQPDHEAHREGEIQHHVHEAERGEVGAELLA